jgi:hypothetical protein
MPRKGEKIMPMCDDFIEWVRQKAADGEDLPNLGERGGGFRVVIEGGDFYIQTLVNGTLLKINTPDWFKDVLRRMIDCGNTPHPSIWDFLGSSCAFSFHFPAGRQGVFRQLSQKAIERYRQTHRQGHDGTFRLFLRGY